MRRKVDGFVFLFLFFFCGLSECVMGRGEKEEKGKERRGGKARATMVDGGSSRCRLAA